MKKTNQTLKKLQKTQKLISNFICKTLKNYKDMKNKVKDIWAATMLIGVINIITSCNVTRTITNESQYYQKGDTAVTIQTKTIETYNAVKNK